MHAREPAISVAPTRLPMLAVARTGLPAAAGMVLVRSMERAAAALRVGRLLRAGKNGAALEEARPFWPGGPPASVCGPPDGMREHGRAANECAQVLGPVPRHPVPAHG